MDKLNGMNTLQQKSLEYQDFSIMRNPRSGLISHILNTLRKTRGRGSTANHSVTPARSLRKTRSSSTLNSAPSSKSGRFRSVFSSDIRRRHFLITS
jgi:hypothetical protein